MGRGFVEYHLPESKRDEWVLVSAFLNYRLPSGDKLSILQQPAWCPSCRAFVIAEELPSVESLEGEIHLLQAANPVALQTWAFVSNGAPVKGRIAELRRRIEWRRGRIRPPRCLYCGALEVVPIPASGEFRHPQTGEQVMVASSGWADTAPWVADFSPEGEHLTEQDAS